MKHKTLYLGTNPQFYKPKGELTHLPMIEVVARPFENFSIKSAFADIPEYTHYIFTSKNVIPIFFDALAHYNYDASHMLGKQIIAIGKITADALKERGVFPTLVAEEETQEGIMHELALLDLHDAYLMIPCSARARPTLSQYLQNRWLRHQMCHIYDTIAMPPKELPEIAEFDKVVFTSPSTVDAFVQAYGALPEDVEIESIGPITNVALSERHFEQ